MKKLLPETKSIIVRLNEGATRRFKVSVKNSSDAIDYRADYC